MSMDANGSLSGWRRGGAIEQAAALASSVTESNRTYSTCLPTTSAAQQAWERVGT